MLAHTRLLPVLAVALTALPATLVAPQDYTARSAAQKYVRTYYDHVARDRTLLPETNRAAMRFVAGVGRGCPNLLHNVPEGHALDDFVRAIYGMTFAAVIAPFATSDETYAMALRRLPAPEPKLAELLRREATNEESTATLKPPLLCAAARSWQRSDFRTVPLATSQFGRHFAALLASPEPLRRINRLMTRFLGPTEKGVLSSTFHFYRQIDKMLTHTWVATSRSTFHVLGLASPKAN